MAFRLMRLKTGYWGSLNRPGRSLLRTATAAGSAASVSTGVSRLYGAATAGGSARPCAQIGATSSNDAVITVLENILCAGLWLFWRQSVSRGRHRQRGPSLVCPNFRCTCRRMYYSCLMSNEGVVLPGSGPFSGHHGTALIQGRPAREKLAGPCICCTAT